MLRPASALPRPWTENRISAGELSKDDSMTILTTPDSIVDSVPTDLWVGGRQTPASTGATFPVHNPATGSVLTHVADASPDDGRRALDLASRTQAQWAATAPRERGEILRAAFESVRRRSEDFATVMTLEMGKAIGEARSEVAYGAEYLRWFAEEAVRVGGRFGAARAATEDPGHQGPGGPGTGDHPVELPAGHGTRKIAPAVAAGCTIIVKPAEETPLTMLLLGECSPRPAARRRAVDPADVERVGTVRATHAGSPPAEGDLHGLDAGRKAVGAQCRRPAPPDLDGTRWQRTVRGVRGRRRRCRGGRCHGREDA